MFDESFSDVYSTDLKRPSRGWAAADVSLVSLDVEETVVELSRCGARGRPVLPLPSRHGGNHDHLER